MKRVTLVSLTVCLILVIVSGISVSTLADIASGTVTKAEQHFEKANELLNRKEYKAAIAEFEEVINISPKSKIAQDAQYWMGQSHFMARQFDAALSAFQRLLDEYSASRTIPATTLMIERVQQAKKNKSFFEAVKKADVEQVKLLIAEGADVDAKWVDVYNKNEENTWPRDTERTALRHAVKAGKIEVVRLLVEAGADVNAGKSPPLLQAVEENNTVIAEYLIDHGANVNPRQDLDPMDWGPLQIAPWTSNNIEMVKLLIARGADISTAGPLTALQISISRKRRDIFDLLIQRGADVNTKDYEGFTPLYFAIHSNDSDFRNILIANGADVNTKYMGGGNSLTICRYNRQNKVCKVALRSRCQYQC